MSYWEFVGTFIEGFTASWFVLSAVLAGLLIVGAMVFLVFGAGFIADEYGWRWNALFIPAVIVATFLVVMLFAWSGSGAAG